MLLVDDEPEEEIPIKEEVIHRSKGKSYRPSPFRQQSNERTQKSLDRKKSIENGIALPTINQKRTFIK